MLLNSLTLKPLVKQWFIVGIGVLDDIQNKIWKYR